MLIEGLGGPYTPGAVIGFHAKGEGAVGPDGAIPPVEGPVICADIPGIWEYPPGPPSEEVAGLGAIEGMKGKGFWTYPPGPPRLLTEAMFAMFATLL